MRNNSFPSQKSINLGLKYASYSALGLSGLLISQFAFASHGEKNISDKLKPNIIIIIADDLGWNDVGYHGSEVKTPVLDKLAKEGIEFNRYYVHTVCSPTRAALLTGRAPSRYGILTPLGNEQGLPAGTVTLAKLLNQNGYETAISGKWHLGSVPEARPLNYGFDNSYGYLNGQIDPYTHLYKTGEKTWHRNDQFIEEEGHATDLITKEAVRFIKKPRTKNTPFFLYVAYSVPHYPLNEPEKWTNLYKGIITNESRRLNAASITHMDNSIGNILAALNEKGLEQNTILFFQSDNGAQKNWIPTPKEYGGKFKVHDILGDNRPLRDWKASPYDGALRVPALMSWTGKLKHMKVEQAVNVADIFPTMAYLAGATVPDSLKLDGNNFWPAIEGASLPVKRVMYWRLTTSFVIKKGDWKLVHTGKKFEEGTDELYNITADPYETKNVSKDNPEIVTELKQEIKIQMSMDRINTTRGKE